jgi:hypothetical protein
LEKALLKKEKKYGLSTEAFLELPEENWPAKQSKDFQRWQKDHRQLRSWQQRLTEYEQVYRTIRGQ